MAVSKSANTYNRQNWEESEFPILCQTCLGDNPYLRMTREKYGKECKICERPFTVFRWCPGTRMRFKKTEVCQTCSKTKNVCQTCLLDLEYGLPVQVRDAAYNMDKLDMPKSDVGREYYTQMMEREISKTDGTMPVGHLGKARPPSEMLMRLARTTPYYNRNRPHICSFWVKGECKRGEECPYRHEKPTDPDDPLSEQNMKDRFFGVNDPVAEKLLRRYQEGSKIYDDEAEADSEQNKEKVVSDNNTKTDVKKVGNTDFFNLNVQGVSDNFQGFNLPPPALPLPPSSESQTRSNSTNFTYYPSQDPSRLGSGKIKPSYV